MTVGILIPVFLRTIAWILLLSPRIGLVNQWAMQLFGLDQPMISLYNIPGMAFIQGVSFVPSAFFMLAAAYRTMDPSLEEAAYTSGVSKFQTFLRINVPITWPAIAGVMVYLFMSAIAVFEVPAIIGFPARILVLSALIFTSTNPPTGLPNYGIAGAYGADDVSRRADLRLFLRRLVQHGKKYTVITGRGYRPRQIALGTMEVGSVGFRVAVSVDGSFYSISGFALGFAAASFATAVGRGIIANFLHKLRDDLRLRRRHAVYQHGDFDVGGADRDHGLERAGFLDRGPDASKFSRLPRHDRIFAARDPEHSCSASALPISDFAYRDYFPVYGTIIIIAIAHTISWIAYGTRTTNGVMIQVHRELEEAGKVAGASTPRVLGRIVLPLIAAGIFNSWIWISMLSYREVTMALALGTRKNLVISTIVWQFWGNGWVPQVSALGVLLVLFAVLVVGLLKFIFSRIGEVELGN